eukprot:scaffold271503_cov18-Tisochrysis_lutea.AAC.1
MGKIKKAGEGRGCHAFSCSGASREPTSWTYREMARKKGAFFLSATHGTHHGHAWCKLNQGSGDWRRLADSYIEAVGMGLGSGAFQSSSGKLSASSSADRNDQYLGCIPDKSCGAGSSRALLLHKCDSTPINALPPVPAGVERVDILRPDQRRRWQQSGLGPGGCGGMPAAVRPHDVEGLPGKEGPGSVWA